MTINGDRQLLKGDCVSNCKDCKDCNCKKNYVLIPAFKRPEFLYYCIALINKAYGADKYKYVFALDHGYDWVCRDVITKYFTLDYEITTPAYLGLNAGKQSYNVLHNLILLAQKSSSHVILIEDDVMISDRFFQWHEAAWKVAPDCFAFVGSKNHNDKQKQTSGKPSECYIGRKADYQGIGTSYNAKMLLEYVAQHDKRDYYLNMIDYCTRNFTESSIGHQFAEQDGLIRRVIEQNNLKVLFPHYPVCYHAGFYGKNRGSYRTKIFLQKVADLGEIIFDCDSMRNNAIHPEWYFDSEPTELELKEIKTLIINAD